MEQCYWKIDSILHDRGYDVFSCHRTSDVDPYCHSTLTQTKRLACKLIFLKYFLYKTLWCICYGECDKSGDYAYSPAIMYNSRSYWGMWLIWNNLSNSPVILYNIQVDWRMWIKGIHLSNSTEIMHNFHDILGNIQNLHARLVNVLNLIGKEIKRRFFFQNIFFLC